MDDYRRHVVWLFCKVCPRGAGSWAECEQVLFRPNEGEVKWRFRMQGHDESPHLVSIYVGTYRLPEFRTDGHSAPSVGVLKIEYVPK